MERIYSDPETGEHIYGTRVYGKNDHWQRMSGVSQRERSLPRSTEIQPGVESGEAHSSHQEEVEQHEVRTITMRGLGHCMLQVTATARKRQSQWPQNECDRIHFSYHREIFTPLVKDGHFAALTCWMRRWKHSPNEAEKIYSQAFYDKSTVGCQPKSDG